MQIKGSVAIVTGANGGIGTEYVDALCAAEAAKIYVTARNAAKLKTLVAIDPARIIPLELEVTNLAAVEQIAAQCPDVTLLINNAGTSLNQGFISAPDLAAARSEIEVNYFGMMSMCRVFAPILKQNGGGAIVNMLSLLARANLPFSGSYSASKAACLSMTHCIRAELSSQKTLVVAVMPGTVDTDLAKDWPDPKVSPTQVVQEALQALLDDTEDVYPGEQAKQVSAQLLSDPKGVEKYLATFLPGATLAGMQA